MTACCCHCERRLGPRDVSPSPEWVDEFVRKILSRKEKAMHYRNGREAKNGDKVVRLSGGTVEVVGTLRDAVPGNDYCNGNIVFSNGDVRTQTYACLCDCLHVDDVAEILKEKGLDKRPAGK